MMMHLVALVLAAVCAIVGGFVLGMLITTSRADEAIESMYEDAVEDCTRPHPHVCRVNGPCNGYPNENAETSWESKWEQELEAEKKGDLLL
jgi:hypothetical protein